MTKAGPGPSSGGTVNEVDGLPPTRRLPTAQGARARRLPVCSHRLCHMTGTVIVTECPV